MFPELPLLLIAAVPSALLVWHLSRPEHQTDDPR